VKVNPWGCLTGIEAKELFFFVLNSTQKFFSSRGKSDRAITNNSCFLCAISPIINNSIEMFIRREHV
jgi:hypothetical protein